MFLPTSAPPTLSRPRHPTLISSGIVLGMLMVSASNVPVSVISAQSSDLQRPLWVVPSTANQNFTIFRNSFQIDIRPANRPAFGGTVPLFYQMSCVPLYHGNVPLFVRILIFFCTRAICNAAAVPRRANHPIERNYGNSVQFLTKIPNGTTTESPCYSVFCNAIDFCRLYTSKKNLMWALPTVPLFAGKSRFFT